MTRTSRGSVVAAFAAFAAFAALASGCAGGRALLASPSDYEDYRGFRMAAHEGTRLARAKAYLERHPQGVCAREVRSLYDAEEPAYFARVATPDGARDYLASLPAGPHAGAASALLREDYERKGDIALARELREGRMAEARFQRALAGRKAASTAVYDALAALLDPTLLGSESASPPAAFDAAARGDRGSLSGLPLEVERDLFFTLPGRVDGSGTVGHVDRVLTLTFTRVAQGNHVVEASVAGEDLFVHWREADTAEALDPTQDHDRALGLAHARERLAGALEAQFPDASCRTGPASDPARLVVLARACHGVRVEVIAGDRRGVPDLVRVVGVVRVLQTAGEAPAAAAVR